LMRRACDTHLQTTQNLDGFPAWVLVEKK
jgi:hypothetical protein